MLFRSAPSRQQRHIVLNAHFGLQGVWMAFPVTYLAMLALQTAYYRLVWRHKQIKRLV